MKILIYRFSNNILLSEYSTNRCFNFDLTLVDCGIILLEEKLLVSIEIAIVLSISYKDQIRLKSRFGPNYGIIIVLSSSRTIDFNYTGETKNTFD